MPTRGHALPFSLCIWWPTAVGWMSDLLRHRYNWPHSEWNSAHHFRGLCRANGQHIRWAWCQGKYTLTVGSERALVDCLWSTFNRVIAIQNFKVRSQGHSCCWQSEIFKEGDRAHFEDNDGETTLKWGWVVWSTSPILITASHFVMSEISPCETSSVEKKNIVFRSQPFVLQIDSAECDKQIAYPTFSMFPLLFKMAAIEIAISLGSCWTGWWARVH